MKAEPLSHKAWHKANRLRKARWLCKVALEAIPDLPTRKPFKKASR